MKKITLFIFLITLFCESSLWAQVSLVLDEKNGFNIFKINESIEKYQNIIKFQFTDELDVSHYIYNGDKITDVLGVKYENLYVSFYRNKLIYIGIKIGNNFDKWTELRNKLETSFGKPYFFLSGFDKHPQIDRMAQWRGNKIRMQLMKNNYSEEHGELKGYIYLEIEPIDKEKNILLDKF